MVTLALLMLEKQAGFFRHGLTKGQKSALRGRQS